MTTEPERVRIQDGTATETSHLAWGLRRTLAPWPVVIGVGELIDGRVVLLAELPGNAPVCVPLTGHVNGDGAQRRLATILTVVRAVLATEGGAP